MRLPRSPSGVYGRLLSATFFLSSVVLAGSLGYYAIGGGRWSYFDCVYMVVITLSTVGYGELLEGMGTLPSARALTLVLIVLGSGTLIYFVSNLTALVVEGDLRGILRRGAMDRAIRSLERHTILCGVGSTGRHIATELHGAKVPFVVIDTSATLVEELAEELRTDVRHVIGDATDDHVLQRAGIERADAIIAALTSDKDNLFVTISARALNARCRIVAKCIEPSSERKLRRAGANAIVSTNYIGAMRLANEVLRPATLAFLDRLMLDRGGHTLRIEEVEIPDGAPIIGRQLYETRLRDEGALVIAVRGSDGQYIYNPGKEQRLERGSSLVVLAKLEDIDRLRRGLASGPP